MHASLEAHATFSTVTNPEVEATSVTFFHLVNYINLIRAPRNTLGIGIDSFKEAQTVQTLLTLIDQIAPQPCTFHLTHFATQDGIFRGIVTFKTDLTHIETVTRINVHA